MNTVYQKTPLGFVGISATKKAVGRVQFLRPVRQAGRVGPVRLENKTKLLAACAKQLSEYFAGARKKFNLPLVVEGTLFQKQVWRELQKIPFGQTVSYGEIARRIGKPKAARAVGGACNKNKIPIIIPCHRVVGASGNLVGFAGGVALKKRLIELEASFLSNR